MNIGFIGCGKLGLGLSLLCEKTGYSVFVSDKDENFINNLNQKICLNSEPIIQRLLIESKNYSATTENEVIIKNSDVIFVFVDTPITIDGNYDTSNIFSITDEFLKASNNDISLYDKVIVIGSSTNPGDCEKMQKILEPYGVKIGYCPIIIPQVDTIKEIQNYNTIIFGSKYIELSEKIIPIFRKIILSDIKSHAMSLTSSEITKIAINSFLATKNSFANLVGDMLINSGLSEEVDIVLSSIKENVFKSDEYFKYGFGFGGSVVPVDNRYLGRIIGEKNNDYNLMITVDEINKNHNKFLKNYFISKNPDKSIPFIFEFISYKKGTNSLEESQRFKLCVDLLEEGYYVYVTDDGLLSSKLNYISEKYDNRLKFYYKKDSIVGYKINL